MSVGEWEVPGTRETIATARERDGGDDVNFVGLKPLEVDVPLIELETSTGEVLDLYNDHSLRATVLDADGLAFEFVSSRSGVSVVRFHAIRNLRVEQPADWAPEESSQIGTFSFGRAVPGPATYSRRVALNTSSIAGRSAFALQTPESGQTRAPCCAPGSVGPCSPRIEGTQRASFTRAQ